MRTIVVGVDGSAAADEALRWAVAEARQWEGNIVAIHAWELPSGAYPVPGAYPADETTLAATAKQLLADASARTVTGPAVGIEERAVRGRATDVLLAAAAEADLLVVGSRGLGALGRLLLGSVSSECVHHAPGAVVVVHEPQPREESST